MLGGHLNYKYIEWRFNFRVGDIFFALFLRLLPGFRTALLNATRVIRQLIHFMNLVRWAMGKNEFTVR